MIDWVQQADGDWCLNAGPVFARVLVRDKTYFAGGHIPISAGQYYVMHRDCFEVFSDALDVEDAKSRARSRVRALLEDTLRAL